MRDLPRRIRDEIVAHGPVSFARFMELALYDPGAGYYARSAARLGVDGDYFTASDVGHAFGRCLARQIAEIDRRLGGPEPFHVVEFGSGRGLLARDIIDAARATDRAWADRLRYVAVDRSRAMRAAAGEQAPEATSLAPDQLETGYRGCLLAVELFDALPVYRLRRRAGTLVEVRVGLGIDEQLVEVETAPDERAAALAQRYGAAVVDDVEAEVCPAALDQLEAMAGALDQGVMVIVDYGAGAERLYTPERSVGTLLAYHCHATNQQFLERIGEQDLTAHVNFSALEDHARSLGMTVLGRTTQERFLIANGILKCFDDENPESWGDPRNVKERLRVKQLVHPSGMGRAFEVLMLSKGCDPPPALRGLNDPFQ